MRKLATLLGSGVALVTLAGGSGIAEAQTADAAADSEEIVVTAQRRSETIQDVPFSISALGGEELEELGANGFETFATRVAGLQAAQATPVNTQFFMRGVSSGSLGFDQINQSSTVGVYFSDVSSDLSAMNPNFQLFDVNRVEVLRGPQGTLYGAGAASGAIRVVPNRPDLDVAGFGFGATVSETYLGEANQIVDVTANTPIVPGVLGVRGNLYAAEYGGVVDNVVTGEDDEDSVSTFGGRFLVRAEPSTNLVADLLIAYQESELDGLGRSALSLGEFETGSYYTSHDENLLGELSVTYDFGSVSLTGVTGYLDKDQEFDIDVSTFLTFLGLPITTPHTFPNFASATAVSQEIRLQSDADTRFSWLVGAFYSQRDRVIYQYIDAPGASDAFAYPPGPGIGLGPDFGVPDVRDRLALTDFASQRDEYAIFGQFSYDLTDRLEVAVGGRYFDSTQDSQLFGAGIFNGGVLGPDDRTTSETGFNPNINVSYEISGDQSVYALASRGFRLGGVNYTVPLSVCGADLAALGYASAPIDFESDSLWNYEIGSKNQFSNGRGTFNVSAYLIEWSDIQSTVSLPCGVTFQENLGSVEATGLEVEFNYRLTSNLTLRSSLTLASSEFQTSEPALGVVAGQSTAFAPDVAGAVALDYRRPLFGGEGFLSWDAQYVGSRFVGVTTADNYELDEFVLSSLRLGYESDDNWVAYLFVNNLFDERALFDHGSDFGGTSGDAVTYARPRTVGITLRRDF
jgi:outer membrane receptor protein involved in Fe transport